MKTACIEVKMLEAMGYIWMAAAVIVIFGSIDASWRGE